MPERDDWRDVTLALLGSWPGRLDEMTATAFIRELMARGIEPGEALRAVRASRSEHPPSAGVILSAVETDRRRAVSARIRAERLAELERQARPLHVVGPGS